jgi:tryptophan-rich sensory protein
LPRPQGAPLPMIFFIIWDIIAMLMAKNNFFLPYKENITKASGNNWLYYYIISKRNRG